jgi:hypothetical protein
VRQLLKMRAFISIENYGAVATNFFRSMHLATLFNRSIGFLGVNIIIQNHGLFAQPNSVFCFNLSHCVWLCVPLLRNVNAVWLHESRNIPITNTIATITISSMIPASCCSVIRKCMTVSTVSELRAISHLRYRLVIGSCSRKKFGW